MKQILIVHDEDADKDHEITNWVIRLSSIESCVNLQEEIFTKWVITRKDFIEISPNKSKDAWTTLAKSISSLESPGNGQDIKNETAETFELDDRLHDLADFLPYLDCITYIFVFLRSGDLKSTDSAYSLAGVLKRLAVWHGVRVTVVSMDVELSPFGDTLVKMVDCQCQIMEDLPQIEWPSWQGQLAVMDAATDEGHILPQFTLHCDDWNSLLKQKSLHTTAIRQLRRSRRPVRDTKSSRPGFSASGRQIEILQEVDLRTFPLFLMTPWTLELQSLHPDSQHIKSYVQDLPAIGLLARLRLYSNLQVPKCGFTSSCSSAAWKEFILSSPTKVTAPAEEPLCARYQFLYFLILPNALSRTSPHDSPLLAKVLLSPSEISPTLITSMDQYTNFRKSQSAEKNGESLDDMKSAISSLPTVKVDKFCSVMENLQKSQSFTMKSICDNPSTNSVKVKALQTMTSALEEAAITKLIERCPSFETCLQENDMTKAKDKCLRWLTGSTRPFRECPDRLALQGFNCKSIKNSSKSENFASSTPLSSRKEREKNAPKDLPITEILSHFKPDGTPKEMPKTPLKLRGKSLCRVPSHPDLSTKWPANQFLKYHDVFFYNSENDFDFEKKFAEIRDKGYFDDTRSSFVTPKKKPPTRQITRLSPVRSSPRSKGGHSGLTRAHSQSLSKLSPMKRFKTARDLFKHPSSQSIRKSPRKRLASSLTPSSDPPPLKAAWTYDNKNDIGSDIRTPVRRSPRKQVCTSPVSRGSPHVKRLSLTPVSDKLVRRSPRKTPGSSTSFGPDTVSKPKSFGRSSSQSSIDLSSRESSQDSVSKETKAPKMKRSERHKMRLQNIIAAVLKEKDVKKQDTIYSACFRNLFNVSLVLLKALPNSQNLTEEMKTVVYGQVQQIINLEKRRSGIAI